MDRKLILLIFFLFPQMAQAWGFMAHRQINRLAVFSLPPEMLGFYKKHLLFLTEAAVNPDKRRYILESEGPHHYLDTEAYERLFGDSVLYTLPMYWKSAYELIGEENWQAYGNVPWQVEKVYRQLIYAFQDQNVEKILKISADLGHYIGDLHVPLHSTENYNGQLTNQTGIHALWESRLAELFIDSYSLWVGKAQYEEEVQVRIWEALRASHAALDSVLSFERAVSEKLGPDKKFSLEERNGQSIRTYSRSFARAYHRALNGQVERRMKASIKMLADFWLSAWVMAGQPDLNNLTSPSEGLENPLDISIDSSKLKKKGLRPHEGRRLLQEKKWKGKSLYLIKLWAKLPKNKYPLSKRKRDFVCS